MRASTCRDLKPCHQMPIRNPSYQDHAKGWPGPRHRESFIVRICCCEQVRVQGHGQRCPASRYRRAVWPTRGADHPGCIGPRFQISDAELWACVCVCVSHPCNKGLSNVLVYRRGVQHLWHTAHNEAIAKGGKGSRMLDLVLAWCTWGVLLQLVTM